MCVGVCTKTCEHVCVGLHIHPNLHTYSLCVCVYASHFVLYDQVWVAMYYAIDFCVFMHSILVFN